MFTYYNALVQHSTTYNGRFHTLPYLFTLLRESKRKFCVSLTSTSQMLNNLPRGTIGNCQRFKPSLSETPKYVFLTVQRCLLFLFVITFSQMTSEQHYFPMGNNECCFRFLLMSLRANNPLKNISSAGTQRTVRTLPHIQECSSFINQSLRPKYSAYKFF